MGNASLIPASGAAAVATRQVRRSPRWLWLLGRVAFHAVATLGAVTFVYPFLFMLTSSLTPEAEVFAYPPRLIPSRIEWTNYWDALVAFNFLRGLSNTLLVAAGGLAGTLFSCTLVAFGFARLRAPGRNVLFGIVLATMMLPGHVTLIPTFIVFAKLGWLNTFLPLIVPSFFARSAFLIFLLRQFFRSIPREYDDAARIDGCGYLGIYWRIIIPQSLPVIGVLCISVFQGAWNDFMGPLLYLNDIEKMTLSLALKVWEEHYRPERVQIYPIHYILAISTVMTLVPVALFFVTQRFFIQGIVISGVKG